MKDRNVEFPNRYHLTKVAGTDDIYDLTPAPGAVYEEGTFRNKANDLSDDTAAMFGFSSNAVQNSVFAFLGKYNLHWWRKKHSAAYYTEQLGARYVTSISVHHSNPDIGTIQYYDSISFDAQGNFIFGTAHTLQCSYNTYTNANILKGKYFYSYYQGSQQGQLFYMPVDAQDVSRLQATDGLVYYYIKGEVQAVMPKFVDASGQWEYVYSADRNAYPDSGIVDSIEYQYVGIPYENSLVPTKIATGKYTGTGTYGASNPNSLTFDFKPRVVFIFYSRIGVNGYDQGNALGTFIFNPYGLRNDAFTQYGYYGTGIPTNNNSASYAKFDDATNTLYWYHSVAQYQANDGGSFEYHYFAIG